MVMVWATPGVLRAIWSMLAMAARVRCSDAESGNCTLTIDAALVLLRHEARGAPPEHPVGQQQQDPVDQPAPPR